MNKDGEAVSYNSDEACKFCISGAYQRQGITDVAKWERLKDLIYLHYRERNYHFQIPGFNDDPRVTYQEMVTLVREAGL